MFNLNSKPFIPRKRCAPSNSTENKPGEDLPAPAATMETTETKETAEEATAKLVATEEPAPEEEKECDDDDDDDEEYYDDEEYDDEEEEEEPPTSDQVCTFWLKGECLVVNCPFLHTNIGVLCKFYKSGNCIMGDDCIYTLFIFLCHSLSLHLQVWLPFLCQYSLH